MILSAAIIFFPTEYDFSADVLDVELLDKWRTGQHSSKSDTEESPSPRPVGITPHPPAQPKPITVGIAPHPPVQPKPIRVEIASHPPDQPKPITVEIAPQPPIQPKPTTVEIAPHPPVQPKPTLRPIRNIYRNPNANQPDSRKPIEKSE